MVRLLGATTTTNNTNNTNNTNTNNTPVCDRTVNLQPQHTLHLLHELQFLIRG